MGGIRGYEGHGAIDYCSNLKYVLLTFNEVLFQLIIFADTKMGTLKNTMHKVLVIHYMGEMAWDSYYASSYPIPTYD